MVLKHEKTTLKWWIFQSRLTDTRQTIKAIAGAARCCPFFLHKTYIANVQSNLISIRFIFGARFWRSKIPPFEFASSLSVCIIIFFFCIYIYVLFCYSILIHRLWHGHGKELFLHVFFFIFAFFVPLLIVLLLMPVFFPHQSVFFLFVVVHYSLVDLCVVLPSLFRSHTEHNGWWWSVIFHSTHDNCSVRSRECYFGVLCVCLCR